MSKRKHKRRGWRKLDSWCVYCGATKDLSQDHILPQSQGGFDTPANKVTACEPCNRDKDDWVPEGVDFDIGAPKGGRRAFLYWLDELRRNSQPLPLRHPKTGNKKTMFLTKKARYQTKPGESLSAIDQCFYHTKLRALERYGMSLSRKHYEILCDICRHQDQSKALNVEKTGDVTQLTYRVQFQGRDLYLVFETNRECVTTMLPPEAFEPKTYSPTA